MREEERALAQREAAVHVKELVEERVAAEVERSVLSLGGCVGALALLTPAKEYVCVTDPWLIAEEANGALLQRETMPGGASDSGGAACDDQDGARRAGKVGGHAHARAGN